MPELPDDHPRACVGHHRQMVDGYRQRFFLALHRLAALATVRGDYKDA
jgi:hypothetical protein